MKKRFFAIFTCSILAAALVTGCGNKATESPVADNPAVEEAVIPEVPENEALTELYSDASRIYAMTDRLLFDIDTEKSIVIEDDTYHKIVDERFASYDEFQNYLHQYFTRDFTQENLLDDKKFIEGKDGYLYVLSAGRGANSFYAGYGMGEPVVSENEITFDVTAYYTIDKPYDGEFFENEFPESEEFETSVFQFRLVPEDGAWKFNEFTIFY